MTTHTIQLNALVEQPSAATQACLAAVKPDPLSLTTGFQVIAALLNRVAALEKHIENNYPDTPEQAD